MGRGVRPAGPGGDGVRQALSRAPGDITGALRQPDGARMQPLQGMAPRRVKWRKANIHAACRLVNLTVI